MNNNADHYNPEAIIVLAFGGMAFWALLITAWVML